MFVPHYTRMFPDAERPASVPDLEYEQQLAAVGELMIEEGEPQTGALTAGYTYFGQFIDHDLTLDLTPLDYAQPRASKTRNFRTPFLDLDHVYGAGPTLSPFLYNVNSEPGKERFLIGWTKNTRRTNASPSQDDLPRNVDGTALVGDPRQDENLIIAQLHVAFLKLHNVVVNALDGGNVENFGPAEGTLFDQARRLVTWHYQYMVLNDFVGNLVIPGLLSQSLSKPRSQLYGGARHFGIPLEFSVAGFRFGHSMVRDDYDYNLAQGSVTLLDLFSRTGSGPIGNVPLPADWVINWGNFFDLGNIPHQDVNAINVKLAKGLHNLHIDMVKLYKASRRDEPPELSKAKSRLSVRTLWRGARVGLPLGQDLAALMDLDPLNPDRIGEGGEGSSGNVLKHYGLHKATPLWYYILKEAEIDQMGARLGRVGSRIVADTIVGALRADPNSYLSVNPKWKPTLIGDSPEVIGALLLLAQKAQFGAQGS